MKKEVKGEKIQDLMAEVKKHLDDGTYRFSNHGLERKDQRTVAIPDITNALRNGYHEKKKDCWEEAFKSWNYSVRGKSIDGEDLRIIVSFEVVGLLIITVIRLGV